MLRGRRFPAWLMRRGYFRRIERWAKPKKRTAPPSVGVPEPVRSNVLPFPEQPGDSRRAPFAAERGVGTG